MISSIWIVIWGLYPPPRWHWLQVLDPSGLPVLSRFCSSATPLAEAMQRIAALKMIKVLTFFIGLNISYCTYSLPSVSIQYSASLSIQAQSTNFSRIMRKYFLPIVSVLLLNLIAWTAAKAQRFDQPTSSEIYQKMQKLEVLGNVLYLAAHLARHIYRILP